MTKPALRPHSFCFWVVATQRVRRCAMEALIHDWSNTLMNQFEPLFQDLTIQTFWELWFDIMRLMWEVPFPWENAPTKGKGKRNEIIDPV